MPEDVARTFDKAGVGLQRTDTCEGAQISTEMRKKRGDLDPLGDRIDRIFVMTEQFIIYAVELSDDSESNQQSRFGLEKFSLPVRNLIQPSNHIWLRAILVDDYACARVLRGRIAGIAPELTRICDIVDSVCASGGLGLHTKSYRRRTAEVMARAMQMAFEQREDVAKKILAALAFQVTTLRDSKNRMRYVIANALMLLLLVLGIMALKTAEPIAAMNVSTGGAVTVNALDVLAAGAIGAFFSVSMTIRSLVVNHAINRMEMLWTGAARVLIGVIAAAVTILLFAGGWVFGSIAPEFEPWTYLLLGFSAGFSEMLVPNALQQVETNLQVRRQENQS